MLRTKASESEVHLPNGRLDDIFGGETNFNENVHDNVTKGDIELYEGKSD